MPVPIVPASSVTRNSEWLRILSAQQVASELSPMKLRALQRSLPPRLRTAELPTSELGPVRPYRRHVIAAALWVSDLRWMLRTVEYGERARGLLHDFQRRYFTRPVHAARGKFITRAIRERARERGKTPAAVREDAIFNNLRLALVVSGDPLPETFSKLRQRLNELVTRDFLGEDWRHRHEHSVPASMLAESRATAWGHSPESEAELAGELWLKQELPGRARLSSLEAEFYAARLEGVSAAAWARSRGLAASTARNLAVRVRRKLRAVM